MVAGSSRALRVSCSLTLEAVMTGELYCPCALHPDAVSKFEPPLARCILGMAAPMRKGQRVKS
jgi:hypothetical protein